MIATTRIVVLLSAAGKFMHGSLPRERVANYTRGNLRDVVEYRNEFFSAYDLVETIDEKMTQNLV